MQAELTYSAISLGSLLPQPLGSIVLDLGAGGGLSTLTLQALAAESQTPFVLAFDTSAHMLASATQIQESSLVGIRLQSIGSPKSQPKPVDLSTGLPWVSSRCDRILADMSQPLPLRTGVANAVLSVSAVQWLLQLRSGLSPTEGSQCEDARPCQTSGTDKDNLPQTVPQAKLERLFQSLKNVAVADAKLAMQFYPPKGDFDFGARALQVTARKECWAANVVMDFPHHPAPAKKWFLVANRFDEQTDAWCALCWPVVVGRCALQGNCEDIQRERAQQQHSDVVLRLVRCGRRLRATSDEEQLKVQEHLRQQLHPLQIELAKRLDAALEIQVDQLESMDTGEANGEETRICKRPRHVVNETKTELRSVVASSLPQLINILHRPPAEEWTQPPPPLESVAEI